MPQRTICRAVKPPPQNIPTPTHSTTVAANDTNGNRAMIFAQPPATAKHDTIINILCKIPFLAAEVTDTKKSKVRFIKTAICFNSEIARSNHIVNAFNNYSLYVVFIGFALFLIAFCVCLLVYVPCCQK